MKNLILQNSDFWVTFILCVAAALLLFVAYKLICVSFGPSRGNASSNKTLAELRRLYNSSIKDDARPYSVVYVGMKPDKMKEFYSNDVVSEAYDISDKILRRTVDDGLGDAIAKTDGLNYVILTRLSEEEADGKTREFFEALSNDEELKKLRCLPDTVFGIFAAGDRGVPFDIALSDAKKVCRIAASEGKKCKMCTYTEICEAEEFERLEKFVIDSIETGNIGVYFQPFIRLCDRKIIGGEFLTRIKHPSKGVIMPSEILPIVEKNNIRIKFDTLVFEKCCEWVAGRSRRAIDGCLISCNFFRRTLADDDLVVTLENITKKYGVDRRLIGIEVTETEISGNSVTMRENLQKLHSLGYRIMLDDYGTGYTSYDDLMKYPIDIVKIDRKIISEVHTEIGKIVFNNIISLIKALDITILCEGVENVFCEDILREIGCDVVQGYIYYEAMESHDFARLLDKQAD